MVLPIFRFTNQGPSDGRSHLRVSFLVKQRVDLQKPAASREQGKREREIREIICTGNFLNGKHYPDLMLRRLYHVHLMRKLRLREVK